MAIIRELVPDSAETELLTRIAHTLTICARDPMKLEQNTFSILKRCVPIMNSFTVSLVQLSALCQAHRGSPSKSLWKWCTHLGPATTGSEKWTGHWKTLFSKR